MNTSNLGLIVSCRSAMVGKCSDVSDASCEILLRAFTPAIPFPGGREVESPFSVFA